MTIYIKNHHVQWHPLKCKVLGLKIRSLFPIILLRINDSKHLKNVAIFFNSALWVNSTA